MSDWKNVQYKDGKMRTSEGGGGSSTFAGLDDVSFNNIQNGQVPKYNSTTQKWENADESGGGGTVTDVQVDGVSVVNKQGVAEITMPTPPTIPVEDVKVNGTSVVNAQKVAEINSYKEVTQAEYNALPDSKLNDGILYAIKDVGGSDGFPPLIYSDEEREVGVWRDGKPLYQKTVTFGNIPSGTNNYTVQMGLSNVDKVIDYDVIAYMSSSNTYAKLPLTIIHLPYSDLQAYSSTVQSYTKSTDTIRIDTGSGRALEGGYVTMLYTKTTDTAGSGTWTTQGGYAHHYSTDEHIIGTWIDGKPLYEKTIYISTSTETAHGISDIEQIVSMKCVTTPSANDTNEFRHIPFVYSGLNSNWIAGLTVGATNVALEAGSSFITRHTNAYLTLQYTKTTD